MVLLKKEDEMKQNLSGEITLETAIIMPIVMIIVGTFLSVSLYVHDVVTIKSSAYSLAMEYRTCNFEEFREKVCNKVGHIPLFSMSIKAKCTKEGNKYKVNVYPLTNNNAGWLIKFWGENDSIIVEVQKKMSIEAMYVLRAVMDNLE